MSESACFCLDHEFAIFLEIDDFFNLINRVVESLSLSLMAGFSRHSIYTALNKLLLVEFNRHTIAQIINSIITIRACNSMILPSI